METLLFSLKFFLKISGVVMASYLGTDETISTVNHSNSIVVDTIKPDSIDFSQEQKTIEIDSTQMLVDGSFKIDIELGEF